MPTDSDPVRLLYIIGFTIGIAVLGTALAGDAVRSWYPTLTKGRIEIPIALFAVVGPVFSGLFHRDTRRVHSE